MVTLQPPATQDIVLIGGTGDLAQRKLLPAIYNLFLDGLLPLEGRIIGYARREGSDETFRKAAAGAIKTHSRRPLYDEAWDLLCERLTFVSGAAGGFAELRQRATASQRLIFLATPPSSVGATVEDLAKHDLVEGTRLVVEKPFGHDLASARELDATLHRYFDESQIFRIDHYLGKETVQNILVFRFGNSLFERVWNRDAIEHVQMTVAESIGVEGRGGFYEEVGALRDMVQNHVLQILAVLTMEPPAAFDMKAIRDEKAKLLDSLRPVQPQNVVRGQYARGVIDGAPAPGYREEPGVRPDSDTETFVAMQLEIDNWRWANVPFFVRTGKRLPRRVTEVHIAFREAPVRFFEGFGVDADELRPNHLLLRIQPDEGITFAFMAKAPGPGVSLHPVSMHFSYGDSFLGEPAEAYELLLHDAMEGDATLFLRSDGVERAWEVLQPVLDAMPPVNLYSAGEWGPREADRLTGDRGWHLH